MDSSNLEDCLIVSSPGVGGITYLEGLNQVILSTKASTGVYIGDEGFFCGRQDNGGSHLLVSREGNSQLVQLDARALDIHDVFINDGLIYVVATQNNEVVCFDCNLKPIDSWRLNGEEDSSHINSVAIYKDKLIASAFGNFNLHRQYKNGTRGHGHVFDVRTGETIISGLSQPHSLTVDRDYLYLCSSEENSLHVYDNQQLISSVQIPGYARGIAIGKDFIYVGISLSRNASLENSTLSSGAIAIIEKPTMKYIGLNMLSFREIYDIRIVKNYSDIFRMFEDQQYEIESISNALEKSRNEIEERDRLLDERDKRIELMIGSNSWKLTKPIRLFKTTLSNVLIKRK